MTEEYRSRSISIADVERTIKELENQPGGDPTHFVFSPADIALQRKYCEDNDIRSVSEFFLHLIKDMAESLLKDD